MKAATISRVSLKLCILVTVSGIWSTQYHGSWFREPIEKIYHGEVSDWRANFSVP